MFQEHRGGQHNIGVARGVGHELLVDAGEQVIARKATTHFLLIRRNRERVRILDQHGSNGRTAFQRLRLAGQDRADPRLVQTTNAGVSDQSRVGAILTGEAEALKGGPPVRAMLIQNTNPLAVAPYQEKVRRGFSREDLFTCVHEQFMTDTACYADIVLPATMFLEHDDIYTAGGHQHLQFAPKAVNSPEGCRSNHEVITALARQRWPEHPAFSMSPREMIDWTLRKSRLRRSCDIGKRTVAPFATPIRGCRHPLGPTLVFRTESFASRRIGKTHRSRMTARHAKVCPTIGQSTRALTTRYRFKLTTSPARNFLNSTFARRPPLYRGNSDPKV